MQSHSSILYIKVKVEPLLRGIPLFREYLSSKDIHDGPDFKKCSFNLLSVTFKKGTPRFFRNVKVLHLIVKGGVVEWLRRFARLLIRRFGIHVTLL